MMSWFERLAQYCVFCHQASRGLICPYCEQDMSHCVVSNTLQTHENNHHLDILATELGLSEILTIGEYRWPLDSMIRTIKFKRQPTLYYLLTQWFKAQCLKHSCVSPDGVIAVPASPYRWFTRGYNLPGLMAADLSDYLALEDLSHRVWTQSRWRAQHRLNREARLLSQSRFTCAPLPDHVQCVVIMDDVVTTGATLAALAKAIRLSHPNIAIAAWCCCMTA